MSAIGGYDANLEDRSRSVALVLQAGKAGLGPFIRTLTSAGKVGSQVQILGQGFTGATSVTFNGVAATFTVDLDTYLTAVVPAGATTGPVQVTTTTGTLSNANFGTTQ